MRALIALGLLAGPWALAAQSATIVDSAGVSIVRNQARADAQVAFRLGDQPTLEVKGSGDGFDTPFIPVALRLPGGGLAVAESAPASGWSPGTISPIANVYVHYFDASGRLLHTVSVPAPIHAWCLLPGDSILAGGQNVLLVLAPDGTVARLIRTGGAARGCLADKSMVFAGSARVTGRMWSTEHVWSVASNGGTTHDFGELTGSPALLVTGMSSVFSATRMSPEINEIAPGGRLLKSIRTADPLDSINAAQVAAIENRPRMPGVTYVTDVVGIPPAHPSYNNVMTDPLGRIWVEDYARQPNGVTTFSNGRWTAFDSAGRMIGSMQLPASSNSDRWDIASIGTNEVVVRRRIDLAHVVFLVYPLRGALAVPSP